MKALVLAGGFPQITLLNELNKRNIRTILADWNENPIAKEFADYFYQVSTLDVDAITNIARNESVDFIITACTDQALLTVARVSEILELPCYVDYQTALNVTNKSYMKEVFLKKSIPSAKFVIASRFSDKLDELLKYPLIVKPVDCNSSKGVKKVEAKSELECSFYFAKEFSRTNFVIVEEFIEGKELSVDVYVENGEAKVLAISELMKIPNLDGFVIYRGEYLHDRKSMVYVQAKQIAQKIADAFGLVNSPMLVQMIDTGDSQYVVEFSARTGGGDKHFLIKRVCGVDVISLVVDLTQKKVPYVEIDNSMDCYYSSEFIYCFPGKIDHIEGLQELIDQGIVVDFCLLKEQGTELGSVSCSSDRVASFMICANSEEDLIINRQLVYQNIKVCDVDGNDILMRDLYLS